MFLNLYPPPTHCSGDSVSPRVLHQDAIFNDSNNILLEGILLPFDLDTRLHMLDGLSPNEHHEVDNVNSNMSEPDALNPDPDEIYQFLAQRVGNTPGAPHIGSLGTPPAPDNTEEHSMLSRFLTVMTSDEPLVHEARQAINTGRIFEGQDMLRTRMQEEEWQGQWPLTRDCSLHILVTQESAKSSTECEDHSGVVTAGSEFQQDI